MAYPDRDTTGDSLLERGLLGIGDRLGFLAGVDAAAALQADIQKKTTERQRAAEDAGRAMREMQTRTLEQIQTDLLPLIEQVRKDLGLDVILDVTKGGVVYFTPALDLTAEVIKRYDALKAAPPAKK